MTTRLFEMMHLSLVLLASSAVVNGLSIARKEVDEKSFVIEFAPGQTQVVSEAEKWELKAVCVFNFKSRLCH